MYMYAHLCCMWACVYHVCVCVRTIYLCMHMYVIYVDEC